MENGKGKVTIRDVARHAGVSIATVSRYLNRSGSVDKETGLRIDAAVKAMHYAPSMAARSLKTKRNPIVLLVVPDICNPFYSGMAKHVQHLVGEHGYAMMLYNTNGEQKEEEAAVRMVERMNADGVLFASINANESVLAMLQQLSAQVVWLNAYEDRFDSVCVSRRGGTFLAAQHLIELGHKRIAFAGGSPNSTIGKNRREGYECALTESGLPLSGEYRFEMGFSQEDGYKAGCYFSVMADQITAICCANDLIALGVMDALKSHGIRVPEDISVTGMDDIPYARTASPQLTTVTNDSAVFAREGVKMLFERIEGRAEGPARRMEIEHELVVRASSAAPCR